MLANDLRNFNINHVTKFLTIYRMRLLWNDIKYLTGKILKIKRGNYLYSPKSSYTMLHLGYINFKFKTKILSLERIMFFSAAQKYFAVRDIGHSIC